jgi:hypothetical protein
MDFKALNGFSTYPVEITHATQTLFHAGPGSFFG